MAGLHLSWATKLAVIVAWSFASAAWLRYCCSSRTGWLQLAATLPLFAANAAAPLFFSTGLAGSSLEGDLVEVAGGEPVSRAFTAFLLTWLANFKAVAAAVNRGEHRGCTSPWRRFCSAVSAAAAAAATVALPLFLSLPLHASHGTSQASLPNRTMLHCCRRLAISFPSLVHVPPSGLPCRPAGAAALDYDAVLGAVLPAPRALGWAHSPQAAESSPRQPGVVC